MRIIFNEMIRKMININIRYILRHKYYMDLSQFQYSSSIYKKDSNNQSNTSKPQKKQPKSIQNSSLNNSKKVRAKPSLFQNQKVSQTNLIQSLDKILQWRSKNEAPVDTMGCQRLADIKAPIQIQKYQTLVSLMLSVQTKDETTSMCVNRLKQYGLQPQKISKIQQSKLIQLIYQCNFNKRKAKNIIEVSKLVVLNGLAKTKEGLMAYPGVGVKITTIYMNVAENKQQGIGVDTHVHRISNKLGWVKTQSPNETEQRLQEVVPKKYWKDINIAMVGFGQLICHAKIPLCSKCPVSNLCPSSSIKW